MDTIVESATDIATRRRHERHKGEHPGSVVLVRCGDQYRAYGRDAQRVARAIGCRVSPVSADPRAWMSVPASRIDIVRRDLADGGMSVVLVERKGASW